MSSMSERTRDAALVTLLCAALGTAVVVRAGAAHARSAQPQVTLLRVPHGGIQPQVATDEKGTLHLIYFAGDPSHGDLYHVHSADAGASFSDPIRVNREPGNDLFVVINRGWAKTLDGSFDSSFDRASSKLQYTFRF